MGWNHRVMRRRGGDEPHKWEVYAIHEVYYDEDGKPNGWTVEPISVSVSDDEDIPGDALRWTLEKMLECIDKPWLDYETGKEIDR